MEQNSRNKNRYQFKYFNTAGRIALIFLAGFSLYLFISTAMIIFLTRPAKEVKIPDIIGEQFTDIYNSLQRKGLKADVSFSDVHDIDNGIILNQNPQAGKIVPEGSSINLLVSRSSFRIDVPNLVGAELPVAVNRLQNLHYHDKSISICTGAVSYIPSDKSAENIVIAQSPAAGEKITPDRKVNLLVSAGKTGNDMTMPEVTGQSIDLCYNLLAAKGVSVLQEIVPVYNVAQSGQVAYQKPAAGARLTEGYNVVLGVSLYALKGHPYTAYENFTFTLPANSGEGTYQVVVEDNSSTRTVYSAEMTSGGKISAVFKRTGNAKITVMKDKKSIQVIGINVDEYK